jgi:hypothetical protein
MLLYVNVIKHRRGNRGSKKEDREEHHESKILGSTGSRGAGEGQKVKEERRRGSKGREEGWMEGWRDGGTEGERRGRVKGPVSKTEGIMGLNLFRCTAGDVCH